MSFQGLDFGGVEIKSFEDGEGEGGNKRKQAHFYATQDLGDFDDLGSDSGFDQENTAEGGFWLPKYQQRSPFSNCEFFDNLHFNIVSPPLQSSLEEIPMLDEIRTRTPELVEPAKEKQYSFPLALELLNSHGSGVKRFNGEAINKTSNGITCTKVGQGKLSTEDVMRVAGAKFIQSCSQGIDGLSSPSHPFGPYFSGLSNEEFEDVQLSEFLLAAAEKVGSQQFDAASRLLNQCDHLSSYTGNPVQRIVYYFSEALREKIGRETGRITSWDLERKQYYDLEKAMMSPNPTSIAVHQGVPFCQVAQFTGMQAILENVAEAKKVHVIDFAIRNGVQWTILMQALAVREECPLELLKITAVGTTSKSKIEDTGKRLLSFAQSMGLPFSFKIVMVPDMLDLKEDLFELDDEEAVVVYSQFLLRTMIGQPDRLESLMGVVRNINPGIVLVTEVEANHNSPAFVTRFTESLFFFSAYFDCLDACMDREDPNRLIAESVYFGQGIQKIVATEGEERSIRNVKIDVWRAFFARFGMVETELSKSSLYQASLVAKKFACGSSCTLDMNRQSLIIGWKGTPMHSVSAWKFQQ